MTENMKPTADTRGAARRVIEWLEQFGTMIGLDPDVAHRANHAPLRVSDVRALVTRADQADALEAALRSTQRGLIRMEQQRDALRAAICRAAGVDPDQVSETDTDYEALVADVARRVPPVERLKTTDCHVFVIRPDGRRDTCGAVLWLVPTDATHTNWRCAAGHDQDSPDIIDARPSRMCECTGATACEWQTRAGEQISVCTRCGGDRA